MDRSIGWAWGRWGRLIDTNMQQQAARAQVSFRRRAHVAGACVRAKGCSRGRSLDWKRLWPAFAGSCWVDRSIRLHYVVRNVNRSLSLNQPHRRRRPALRAGFGAASRGVDVASSSGTDVHIIAQQAPTPLVDRPTRPHGQHRWRRINRGRGERVRCQQQPGPEARVSAAGRCDRR